MYPYSLHIPYSLEITTKTGPAKAGFVAEFDCQIDVDYEDDENWEITSVTVEQSRWNDEFSISAKTDPDLWKIVLRSIDADWKAIQEKILEWMGEDYSDRRAARCDDAHDAWVESR